MERTPYDSDDNKPKKKGTTSYVSYNPSPPAPQEAETRPVSYRPERTVPFIPPPELLLYDRKIQTADTSPEDTDEDDDSDEDTKKARAKHPYVVPPADLIAEPRLYTEQATEDKAEEAAEEPEAVLSDAFGELPPIGGTPTGQASPEGFPITAPAEDGQPQIFSGHTLDTKPNPSFAEYQEPVGDFSEAAAFTPTDSERATSSVQPPMQPRPATPNPNQYNTPPEHTSTGGNQPPLTPNLPPPGAGNFATPPGNVPPALNPNMYPGTPAGSPNYNYAPAPAAGVEQHITTHNADIPARLAAVYSILRGRSTRKKHGKRLSALEQQGKQRQQETGAMNYNVQKQQQRFGTEQYRQGAEIRRMQTTPQAEAGGLARPNIQPGAPLPETKSPVAAAEQPTVEEQQDVRHSERRRYQDAWLQHEVEHGREVVDPAIRGEAYHQERRQEILPDQAAYDATYGKPAAGMAAQQQSAQTHPNPLQQGILPSGMTSPALPPGQPYYTPPDHQLTSQTSKPKASTPSSLVFWIMLVVIIAAFFAAALI